MPMFLHRHVVAYKEENGMHSATESAHAPALIPRPPPMGPQGRPHLEGFLAGHSVLETLQLALTESSI